MTAAEYLVAHPEIPHGVIRIAFTPDEEVGRGTRTSTSARFGAQYAYTLDGGARGELEFESFSADAIAVTFNGFNTHPGFAKGRMVNAIKLAATFITRLPADRLSPETTDELDGYVHPYVVQAAWIGRSSGCWCATSSPAACKEKEAWFESLAREVVAGVPGASVESKIEESYRNMREVIDHHPVVVERAREAIARAGLTVHERAIRGGTDGSRLSFMGLPTPNLFAGEQNFHSRLEWVSVQDMEKAVDVIVQLAMVWEEQA